MCRGGNIILFLSTSGSCRMLGSTALRSDLGDHYSSPPNASIELCRPTCTENRDTIQGSLYTLLGRHARSSLQLTISSSREHSAQPLLQISTFTTTTAAYSYINFSTITAADYYILHNHCCRFVYAAQPLLISIFSTTTAADYYIQNNDSSRLVYSAQPLLQIRRLFT